MKTLIESYLRNFKSIFPTAESVVEHLFAVNGNGLDLDNKGFLRDNFRCTEAYPFGAPRPFSDIYPWSDNPEFQPFRKLAGCRDVGFAEAAQHFIDCIKVTPDSGSIVEWKKNLPLIEKILLNTPEIVDEYPDKDEGYQKFLSKIESEPTPDKRKVWFFDFQTLDCPDFVMADVHQLWDDYGLGNDNYILKRTQNDE